MILLADLSVGFFYCIKLKKELTPDHAYSIIHPSKRDTT
ncbi:hypothetical protein [Escherichia phage FL38]